MKRGLLLGVIGIIISSTVALASSWIGIITVSNNTTTAYPMLSTIVSTNVTYLVDNTFINSSGNDTRLQLSGTNIPYMLATDKITLAAPIGANTNQSYEFITGQSANATPFSVVTGYGGYVETQDAANLELGNNYNVTGHGYINTTFTTFSANNTLIRKPDAYAIFSANATGNVTAETYLYSTDNRTTALDLSSDVGDYQRYGSRISPYSGTSVYSAEWFLGKTGTPAGIATAYVRNSVTDAIIGSLGGINVASVNASGEWYRFDVPVSLGGVADIRVDIEYSGGDAANTLQVYVVNDCVGAATATGFSVGAWADAAPSDNTIRIAVSQSSVSGIASGYYNWTKQADGVNEWMTLDSSSTHYGSVNSTVISVPNNEMPLILFNTAYYNNSFSISVNGVQQLLYSPNNIISGTVLPDRGSDAINNEGVIVWGSNPAGVTATLSSFAPSEASVTVSSIPDGVQDVAPLVSNNTTKVNPQTKVAPSTPISPLIQILAGQYAYNMNEFLIWIMMIFVGSVVIYGFTLGTFGHVGAAGILGSAVWGLGIVLIGLPTLWLSLSVIGIGVSLAQENR